MGRPGSGLRERWPFWIRLGRTRWHDAFKAVPPSVDAQDDFLAGALLSKSVEIQAQTSTHAMVAIFEPDRLTDRMSAQQGVFLWPGNVDLTVMENLLSPLM